MLLLSSAPLPEIPSLTGINSRQIRLQIYLILKEKYCISANTVHNRVQGQKSFLTLGQSTWWKYPKLHVVPLVSCHRRNLLRLFLAHIQSRSSRGAYQKWASLTGDKAYEFDNFRQYYEKSSQYNPPNDTLRWQNSISLIDTSAWSPSRGSILIGYQDWANPISSWIGKGLSALGLIELPGPVNGDIFGWGWTPFSINQATQTKSSSESSYL